MALIKCSPNKLGVYRNGNGWPFYGASLFCDGSKTVPIFSTDKLDTKDLVLKFLSLICKSSYRLNIFSGLSRFTYKKYFLVIMNLNQFI
jgi:hypothetical protein